MGWYSGITSLLQSATNKSRAAANTIGNSTKFLSNASAETLDSGPGFFSGVVWDEVKNVFHANIVSRSVEVCPINSRKERKEKRQDLIDAARSKALDSSCPKRLSIQMKTISDRLNRNNQAIDDAKLSSDSYKQGAEYDVFYAKKNSEMCIAEAPVRPKYPKPPHPPVPPDPWEAVDPATSGLSDEDIAPEGSTFRATIYKNRESHRTVVAFRGTEPGAGEGTDAKNNDIATDVDSALSGESVNHDFAIKLAKKMSRSTAAGDGLSFTGHSLGGDYAQLAALWTGKSATGFNSKAPAPKYLPPHDGNNPLDASNIKQFRAPCDPLTGVQNSPALQAMVLGISPIAAVLAPFVDFLKNRLGFERMVSLPVRGLKQVATQGGLVPMNMGESHDVPSIERTTDANGISTAIDVPCLRPAAQHSIVNLIDGMEQQKTDDIGTLKAQIDIAERKQF